MSNPVPNAAASERVNLLIADFLERRERGESVDPAAFLAAHPEHANELKSFFAGIDILKQAAGNDKAAAREPSALSSQRHSRDDTATAVPVAGKTSQASSIASPLPEQFGRYRITQLLGQGGMGSVYLARDTQLNRDVALKIPLLAGTDTDELVVRFRREAQAAATLRHTNICPVYDVGEFEGRHFLTMAYIEGRPLTKYINATTPQNQRHVATIVRKLALALAEAHKRGIVHRDLKPANIMIDERGEPVVMDFGLARQIETPAEGQLTQEGMIVGSPAYMSPEQILGDSRRIGPQSDVWSLGVILYELLTGRLPFQGNVVQLIGAIQHADPPALSTVRKGIDPQLEAICRKMLMRPLDQRYQSMADVAQALTACLKTLGKGEPAPVSKPPGSALSTSTVPGPATSESARKAAPASKPLETATDSATQSNQAALAGLARKCLARHDYEQVIQMLEQIPEGRRTDEVAALLDKARSLADEVMFLLTEIEEALRLNDGDTAVRKAEALQKLKPGHHKLREVQEQCGFGKGKRYRTAGRKVAGGTVGEGTWIPWSVLAFGLCVFGVMFWAATLYFRSGDAVMKVTIHDPDVKVGIQGRTLNIESARNAVKVNPGEGTLKITYGDAEFETTKFTLKKGQNPAVDVVLLDDKLAAKFGDQPLGEWLVPGGRRKSTTVIHTTDGGATAGLSPSQILTSPDWEWSEPENLGPGVNSGDREISPSLTSDEKILVFVRAGDVFESRRKSIGEPFAAAVKLGPPISRPNSSQTGVAISGDGLLLVVSSNRGPNTDEDVYLAERKSVNEPFGKVTLLSSPVSSALADRHPALSPDGLTLIISSDRKGGQGMVDLHRFTRSTRSDSFGNEENLGPIVNTPKYDFGGAMTSDGLVLFRSTFLKPPSKARDDEDLGTSVMCLRRSPRDQFESTQSFGPVFEEFPPFHAVSSLDGRRIYFMSRRPGGFGKADLWMGRRVPKKEAAPAGSTVRAAMPPEMKNSIGMMLALIPAGKFIMGSPPEERGRSREEVPHEVEITRPYYLGVTEVTQEEYEQVTGANPSAFKLAQVGRATKRFPVENVTWEEAQEFCRKLSAIPEERQAGRTYRLPTEAEWEYACRGGSTESRPFYFEKPQSSLSASDAILFRNQGMRTTEVRSFKPNGFGLYDMHGSVWEWCSDWYDQNYYVTSPRQDPQGPSASASNRRVVRGGSWTDGDFNCRAASRAGVEPGKTDRWGFRVACDLNPVGGGAKAGAPAAAPAPAGAPADAFQTGSLWTDESAGLTLSVFERGAGAFRARFVIRDTVVREITGTVTGDRISWLAKDVKNIKGNAGGDNVGTVAGDRIDFTWRGPGTRSGAFTLRLKAAEAKAPGASAPAANPADRDRVAADWVLAMKGFIEIDQDGKPQRKRITAEQKLPDEPFRVVTVNLYLNSNADDAGMTNLRGLAHLRNLNLGGAAKLTHKGLMNAGLGEMTSLQDLGINAMGANDATLEVVGTLTQLKTLWLDGLPISDDGLKHVAKLKELTLLSIPGTSVTDAGVAHLKGMTKLTTLRLMGANKVTDQGVAAFQAAVPTCKIDR